MVTDQCDMDGGVEVGQESQVGREEGRVHGLLQRAELKGQLVQTIPTLCNGETMNTVTWSSYLVT